MRRKTEAPFLMDWQTFGEDVRRWMKNSHHSYRSLGSYLVVDKQVFVRIGKGEGCDAGLFMMLCQMMGYSPQQYLLICDEIQLDLFPDYDLEGAS